MNKSLKIAFKKSSNEQGFAIPIAVGMGLIMLLVGTTMIVRSQGDQTTASAQKATSRGLSAAETGITQYQSLINNNRAIATYKDCEGTRDSSGVCLDVDPTTSWANAATTTIPGLSSCGGSSGATVANASTIAWRDVDPPVTGYAGDPSKGQYRLFSYIYPAPGTTGIKGTAPGTGQLIVEGRVNQADGNNDGDDDDNDDISVGTATSRLVVNIPVMAGEIKNFPVPGAWFEEGGMEDAQTGKAEKTVKGNVLLNDCSVNPAPDTYQATTGTPPVPYTDPATGKPYKTTRTNLNFPDIPTKPTIPASNQLGTINSNSNIILPDLTTSPQDIQTTVDGITAYRYSITAINKGDIVITPGEKVIFYLDGNIDKGVDIKHDCSGVSGCKPTDFQVYGYAANGQMCLNGNNVFQGFIFAPTYSVGVTGNGNMEGSVWAKDFGKITNCGSNNPTIVVTQDSDWNTLLSLGLKFNLPPVTSSASSWQRQEAN